LRYFKSSKEFWFKRSRLSKRKTKPR